jgi:UDP-N-acetylglucosamine 2-epimerase (non-hydrolysing)
VLTSPDDAVERASSSATGILQRAECVAFGVAAGDDCEMKSVVSVVGARPNFMKLAPVVRALRGRRGVTHRVVHTGQHYDDEMSDRFFRDLGISPPVANLEVGSGSHAQQTALVMQRLEPLLLSNRPDVVLVYGDVNSTLAAALVSAKLGIRVGHVEAGLRSGDWSMPEEVNRVVTDRVSDLLFAPSRDAMANLTAEGVTPGKIHFVGNVMIDTLTTSLPAARMLDVPRSLAVADQPYVVVTLHRPSNVDDSGRLLDILAGLESVAESYPVLFPMHPRTRAALCGPRGLEWSTARLRLLEPMGYLQMLGLVASAALVVTDSGGLQEETSFLGVPCLTLRPTTERPVTCTLGTNRLVAPVGSVVHDAARAALADPRRPVQPIDRWDGKAAERIVAVLLDEARFD